MTSELNTADAPTDVKHTWREIQDVVQQVTKLSRAAVANERFFGELLDHSIRIMAAIGGAVWLKKSDGLGLEYQVNLGKTGVVFGPESDDSPEVAERETQHLALLNHITSQGQSRAIAPNSGRGTDSTAPSNPSEYLLLLAPIAIDERTYGILEVFQRPDVSPAACQGFLRFLGALADLAADFLRNSRLRDLQDRATLWSDFERFTERVHSGLDPQHISLVMANDGRQLIGCDRVMVAVPHGRKCRVVAVSGSDAIDRRSNVIRAAEELARRVTATRKPFWFDDSAGASTAHRDLPPQLDKALHEHLDASSSRMLAVLPLITPPAVTADGTATSKTDRSPILGALLIESFSGVEQVAAVRYRAEVVARQSAFALANATTYSNLPFLGLLRLLGGIGWHLRLRQLPRTVLVLSLLGAAVAALFLVPADFTIDGRGELQPILRRGVFATSDGIVSSISSKLQGQQAPTVEATESLLELIHAPLEFELTRTTGELQTARQKLNTTQVERLSVDRADPRGRSKLEQLAAEEQELGETIKSLTAQLEVLKKQQANLIHRSPIRGQVLTWDAAQLLQSRPVRQGERLLEVADVEGDWQLEVEVADQNIGFINEARRSIKNDLNVEFVLATDPEVTYQGTLREVSREVRSHPDLGPSVLVTVSVPRSSVPNTHLRPGATVIPHIHCGRRPVGFVWFHELIHTIYSRLMF